MRRVLVLLLANLAASSAMAAPHAPVQRSTLDTNDCPCCYMSCLKPWVIPDRWDDTTVVVGHEDWANNGRYDAEPFTDTNRNGYYDAGEPYKDQNGNGRYDEEYYDPFHTGYAAAKDVGSQIVLKPGSPSGTVEAGHYNAINFTDEERRDATGNRYELDIVNCNPTITGLGNIVSFHSGDLSGPTQRGVEALIAQDPEAHWDSLTQTVVSPNPDLPRVSFLPMADPRTITSGGNGPVVIIKIGAVFLESIDKQGNVVGRFMRVPGAPSGQLCPDGYPRDVAFVSTCSP